MAKKNLVQTLKSERFLIWAVLAAVAVAVGLVGEISISNADTDTEISAGQNPVINKH